jgi:maltose/moltooligosaccharide transporter
MNTTRKPRQSFWQIFNMSFGFLGIQFGFGLQLANMSAIYETLGATPDRLPLLWLAAPLSELIIQPLIGSASDRTWTRLGRRRPYFLVGAILSSLMLVLMPSCTSLWMAACALWILDASINVSMEPFRAFVADLLPEGQRTLGFAVQSLFIGLGAVVASALPWLLTNIFHVSQTAPPHTVPTAVRLSFYIGAAAFFFAVLWTIITTKEYPPENLEAFRAGQKEHRGVRETLHEIVDAWVTAPKTFLRMGLVQLMSFLGLFCMWLYFGVAVAHNVFSAAGPDSADYRNGIEWAGVCAACYNAVCFLFSFALPGLARAFGRKYTHMFCLGCGAIGLMAVVVIHTKWMLLASMVGVGIAWAGILSMPYAILAAILPPERIGVYMGIFNFFIVVPEIIASLFFGWLVLHVMHNDRMVAVSFGGVCLLAAVALMLRVKDPQTLSIADI